jgi:putative membrane-bound dehydrogenase-like protein
MKTRLLSACLLVVCASLLAADSPLRIFIKAGKKTHGPAGNGVHDHPTFLKDWQQMLTERGAVVNGKIGFPSAEELEKTDVLLFYSEEGGRIDTADRANLDKFLKRGGGIVALHDSVCGNDAQWWKTIIGGAWEHGHSKWLEHVVPIYYTAQTNPIVAGASNFEFDDEIYYDLHMMPDVKILAGSWTPDKRNTKGGRLMQHIYDVSPQMWTYETGNHRAFVSIPGHHYKSFNLPHYRSVVLRGIAWAGKRDVNLLTKPEELASLRYPEGGPTSPALAGKKLELHPDFEQKIVAHEPLVNKVMNIDWDPAGNMWAVETPEYPNGRRGIRNDQKGAEWKDHGGLVPEAGKQDRPAFDRISKLTDTDGDGVMDKKEVFYEGLELATSFVFHRDGVIVSQAPDILWLRDKDGDGKAETVEKLYTGLGTSDTHAVINNIRWGFDGWIYGTHGYSGGRVRSPDGGKDFGQIGSGVVRFKPDGSAFEQYCSKNGNTWGLDITSDNEVLFTQPTSNEILNHVVLAEYVLAKGRVKNATSFKAVIRDRASNPLIKAENLAYVQIDLVGKFTAAAGCAIYEGGTWPKEWNYSYFTTEPTINIAHHEVVKPDGVTFTAFMNRPEEFIGGRDPWYRPIETRVGPDGALYIIDFYNQAVIHNDTRGPKHNAVNAAVRPDRDHYFARIWRVNHKQATKINVPDLSKASVNELAAALESPSKPVRFTAHRLLSEKTGDQIRTAMQKVPTRDEAPAWNHRLWLMANAGILPDMILGAALNDKRAEVRKNALRVAALRTAAPDNAIKQAILNNINNSDPRVQLEAIVALGTQPVDESTATALVKLYPSVTNNWVESAIAGVASKNPQAFLAAVLKSENPTSYAALANVLTTQIAQKSEADPEQAAAAVITVANAPASADAVKAVIFESLAKSLKPATVPNWSGELRSAFGTTLKSANPAVPASALPLIARWDKNGSMSSDVKSLVAKLLSQVNDPALPDDQRAQVASSLLGVRQLNAEIVPSVAKIVGSSASADLQRRTIDLLGASGDPSVGPAFAASFAKISPESQDAMFAQIIKRSDWSRAFVDALKQGTLTLASLSPASVHRLRTHADGAVAKRANEVIDELRGPEVKEKNNLVAQLEPEVSKPGNAAKGQQVFTANCATCHQFNGEGKALAPDLTGMGVHGVHEMLVHILDPNRMVEENYMSVSIETKDGETYDGILGRDTRQSVVVRNAINDTEIKTSDIKSRRNTGRSLMPEGFEALGAETLRDLMTYLVGGDSKYRVIDMKNVFTADTRKGLFQSQDRTDDAPRVRKFGLVKVGDVPFAVENPAKVSSGNNVVVLRGGSGFAKTMPQKIELTDLNVKASRLHFLGGIGGWAWPYNGDRLKGMVVAKVTVTYAEGSSEVIELKNGIEFVDWINPANEVPGSTKVPDLVGSGQVRSFTRELKGGTISKITLESPDNQVAPVFFGITADSGPAPKKVAAAQATTATDALPSAPMTWGNGTKALLVGGGSSHDYQKFFNRADSETLKAAGFSVNYTEDGATTARELKNVDVVVLSVNAAKWATADCRAALNDFIKAGKGVVLLHPGMWYNFGNWPEFNRDLVGGGARGHDNLGEFTVNVINKDHPITKGVTPSFKIVDELYYVKPDANGPAMEVLAETSPSKRDQKTYPSVFVVKHPQTRVVGLALGHDARAHELPEYKQLLVNAAKWAAGK